MALQRPSLVAAATVPVIHSALIAQPAARPQRVGRKLTKHGAVSCRETPELMKADLGRDLRDRRVWSAAAQQPARLVQPQCQKPAHRRRTPEAAKAEVQRAFTHAGRGCKPRHGESLV